MLYITTSYHKMFYNVILFSKLWCHVEPEYKMFYNVITCYIISYHVSCTACLIISYHVSCTAYLATAFSVFSPIYKNLLFSAQFAFTILLCNFKYYCIILCKQYHAVIVANLCHVAIFDLENKSHMGGGERGVKLC